MSRSLDNAIHALNTLAKIGRVGDRELGAMLGMSRQTGYAKRHGDTRLSLEDIDALADGLKVPSHVFLMDHQELMRWIGESNWRGPRVPSGQRKPIPSCEQGSLFDSWDLPEDVVLFTAPAAA